ncbi:baseplate hub [Vibrio phage D93]
MKYVDRVYKLSVTKGGNHIEFDGTQYNPLRVRFSVTHYDGGILSQAIIDIFNLSKTSQGIVSEEYADVTLQAGYKNNFGVIFSGQTINHEERREGTDTFIRLYADSGIKNIDEKIVDPRTFNKNTKTSEIIEVIVKYLGMPYAIQDLDNLPLKASGYSIKGTVKQELNRIAKAHGLEWYVENGKVVVKNIHTSLKGKVINVSELENGMIGTPIRSSVGVEFDVHLNPGFRLNQLVNLKAKAPVIQFSGAFSMGQKDLLSRGTHLIKKLTFEGDTHENPWFTRCVGHKPATKEG